MYLRDTEVEDALTVVVLHMHPKLHSRLNILTAVPRHLHDLAHILLREGQATAVVVSAPDLAHHTSCVRRCHRTAGIKEHNDRKERCAPVQRF